MKKTIFLVKASYSSWDDHHIKVLKAFYNDIDAQVYSTKAERILKAMSEHIAEAWRKTKPEYKDDISYEEMAQIIDEYEQTSEYLKALDVWSAHTDLEEFNCCFIEEIEIR
jgi:predicted ArsR family transcriptional regulator